MVPFYAFCLLWGKHMHHLRGQTRRELQALLQSHSYSKFKTSYMCICKYVYVYTLYTYIYIYIYLSTYTICKCLEMSHNDHDHRKIHQTPFSPAATRVDWATLAARAELVRSYLVPVMFPELSEKHLATSVLSSVTLKPFSGSLKKSDILSRCVFQI